MGTVLNILILVGNLVFLIYNAQRARKSLPPAAPPTVDPSREFRADDLAHISHELRTPMHGILSFARFGQQRAMSASPEKLKSYFDEIYASGARLMHLLNSVLDLSKLEAGKVEYSMCPVRLSDLAHDICDEMRAFAEEKHLTLAVFEPATDVTAVCDRERLLQVLRNLVCNAVKFSQPDSIVRLEIGHGHGACLMSVANNGASIPQDELELIFDKFTQSRRIKSAVQGTGLGLPICREIVTQHGGRIWAENSADGMTRFCIQLSAEQKTWTKAS